MKKYNCIVIFDKTKSQILFCERVKQPYIGKYNFVGGKVEMGEDDLTAAYRELQEETGIESSDVQLFRLMNISYYYQDLILDIYVGQLQEEVLLHQELNPLKWLSIEGEDFTDLNRFAGDQNIAHIVNVALKHPLDDN